MNTPNGVNANELSLRKSAAYLGCSPAFLSGVCKRGGIEYHRVGKHIRIRVQDLDLYRAEHTFGRRDNGGAA